MKKLSICVTIKDRSIISYNSPQDMTQHEIQTLQHHDQILKTVKSMNPNVDYNCNIIRKPKNMLGDFIDSINIASHWFDSSFEFELIVTDWGSTDIDVESFITEQIKDGFIYKWEYHKIDQDKFSRGYGLNEAAKLATGDILHFTDVDIRYPNPLDFSEGLDKCESGGAYFPIVYKEQSPMGLLLYAEIAGEGISFVRKEDWEKVGGFPDYRQWGKEDNDFRVKLQNSGVDIKRNLSGIIHQWHSDILRG